MQNDLCQFDVSLSQWRSGDREAIEQFVDTYEPFIRRTIRIRLSQSRLKQITDSIDICQSVLGSFLIRLSAGEYELPTELHLRKLLYSIAKKKFLEVQRRERAIKRDYRITVSLDDRPDLVDQNQCKPDRAISQMELLEHFEKKLFDDERELFQLRRRGLPWNDIAGLVDGEVVALRKRLSRAVQRVAVELGID